MSWFGQFGGTEIAKEFARRDCLRPVRRQDDQRDRLSCGSVMWNLPAKSLKRDPNARVSGKGFSDEANEDVQLAHIEEWRDAMTAIRHDFSQPDRGPRSSSKAAGNK